MERMDLTERRRVVAGDAFSAYKTAILYTMMVGYDLVPGAALEGTTDKLSRAVEEVEKKLRELKMAHQMAIKAMKDDTGKSLSNLTQILTDSCTAVRNPCGGAKGACRHVSTLVLKSVMELRKSV